MDSNLRIRSKIVRLALAAAMVGLLVTLARNNGLATGLFAISIITSTVWLIRTRTKGR